MITAAGSPIPITAIVQLGPGLTFGLTQVGIMGLMVHHVPGHVMARRPGAISPPAAASSTSAHAASGTIYAHYGQGIYYRDGRDGGGAGGLVIWLAQDAVAVSSKWMPVRVEKTRQK